MQYILEYDEFIRSIKQNKSVEHSILLGAGASIESGIQSASDCIWEWKKDIFLSQYPHLTEQYRNFKIGSVQNAIQKWFDNQGIYPKINDESEYSFYAEKTYKIPGDRQRYFQNLSANKSPSLGYSLIALLSKYGMVKSVWTTNFDGLMVKAAHQNNITPIEITLESQNRIYRTTSANELLCIALHGDYKYGNLKNTASELDAQSDKLVNALKHELLSRNFIVLGYSGRDKSLMDALRTAYFDYGAGRLYWCGYGRSINEPVKELIETINNSGREAYYVPTDGFDKSMLNLSLACFENDSEFLSIVNKMKNQISTSRYIKNFDCTLKQYNKVIKSNLNPVAMPKFCYQFQLDYRHDEKPWNVCKELSNHEIVAVPYKEMVYAFGTKENIAKVCQSRLKSDIVATPLILKNIMDISAFKDLMLKAITLILALKNNLECNHKNRIWDVNEVYTSIVRNKKITSYKGLEISLFFDDKRSYISFTPTFILPKEVELEKQDRKEFSRAFNLFVNAQKPNLNYHNYINAWIKRLFNNTATKAEFPVNSRSGFEFTISAKSLYVGLESNNVNTSQIMLPAHIIDKQIVLTGVEYPDPQLQFYNAAKKRMVKDFHPMRGLINNQPYDYVMNNEVFKPYINVGIVCPNNHAVEFYNFISLLNQSHKTRHNIDYLIDYPDFISVYGIALNLPTPGCATWVDFNVESKNDIKETAFALGKQITQRIDQLNAQQNVDVILVYIPEEFEYFTSYKDKNTYFDLHDFVKAFAVQKNISTQFIRQKTITSSLECQIAWSLSLAIYVKALRTPWVLSNLRNDTAFAGIGYSINHYSDESQIIVGCSHIYSADGQGLKYKLSKITDVTYDKKRNPFLSENEAYQVGLNIKELFYRSFSDLPKRVVIHKRTPYKPQEIKGLTESLNCAGIEDIDLVEITYEQNARFFELDKFFSIDGYPVRRGCCFPINDNTAFLFTHGIAPSVVNPYRKYVQGGKSIPVPLKITKHYGDGDLSQIATEILGLSKMNWNSFELYSKLPCTLESSGIIARIGWLLSQYEGTVYDYRSFM